MLCRFVIAVVGAADGSAEEIATTIAVAGATIVADPTAIDVRRIN
jgi:hypothetical protein